MPRRKTRFDMPWPVNGLVDAVAYENQPRGSSVDLQNVRAFDPGTGRSRGAQRAGLAKYSSARVADDQVQELGHVAARAVPTGQSSLNQRTIVPYVITSGTVATFGSGSTTTATNGSSALSTSAPVIFSSQLDGVVYFADGTSEKKWTASTNTVAAWAESAGTMPVSGSDRPRLIETWRGRIVLSGVKGDEHNWFMSKMRDANNWDYAPSTATATQAVAGNQQDAGKSPDIINGMIPFSDDILVFLGDHTIHQMTGDPAESGRIDAISTSVGGAWGRAWCLAPDGSAYFFGSRGGVYRLVPGSKPQNITQGSIEERLAAVNQNTSLIRLVWNDREKGVNVFITDLGGGASTHYFYDTRNNSWWLDKFATADHNPTAVHVYDGDAVADRAILLGGQDGYIRKFDHDTPAANDDSTAIDAYAYLGPIQLQNRPKLMLTEMKGAVGTGSNPVAWDLYAAETAEAAKAGASKASGTFAAGRNRSDRARVTGHDIFIRLRNNTSSQKFSMEFLGLEIDSFDGPRARQW